MRSNFRRSRRAAFAVATGLSMVTLGACGDDPFEIQWASNIDTVSLYSLSRPELGLASAFDFANRLSIVVENIGATGQWDVAINDDGTELWFSPPGLLGVESRAALVPVPGISFDELTEAPADTALYVGDRRVPIEVGQTYAVRTREVRGFFGELCVYYGKIEPTEVDLEARRVEFFFEASPACNDRNLIPTQEN